MYDCVSNEKIAIGRNCHLDDDDCSMLGRLVWCSTGCSHRGASGYVHPEARGLSLSR
jgi:hypothetical protein